MYFYAQKKLLCCVFTASEYLFEQTQQEGALARGMCYPLQKANDMQEQSVEQTGLILSGTTRCHPKQQELDWSRTSR